MLAIASEIQKFYPTESQLPPLFRQMAPLLFRYYRPDGSAAQVAYREEAREVWITFFPKGSITS